MLTATARSVAQLSHPLAPIIARLTLEPWVSNRRKPPSAQEGFIAQGIDVGLSALCEIHHNPPAMR